MSLRHALIKQVSIVLPTQWYHLLFQATDHPFPPCQFKARPFPTTVVIRGLRSPYSVQAVTFLLFCSRLPFRHGDLFILFLGSSNGQDNLDHPGG